MDLLIQKLVIPYADFPPAHTLMSYPATHVAPRFLLTAMASRPLVPTPTQYGRDSSFWVEYPSGLVDLSRTHPLQDAAETPSPPPLKAGQVEISVEGNRTIRVDTKSTVMVIIDMQNFFLHPQLRDHPTGLQCIDPLTKVVPALRSLGVKIIWLNWGLTEHELKTIPPALVRSFQKNGRGGFGFPLPHDFGRLLMRGARNSELYGPLQDEFIKGKVAGTDFWIHKNRMSGLWGYQTALDLFLQENGTTTLLFGGVNADQCVLGTIVDAYFKGYDCVVVRDATATTSPEGGLANVLHNAANSYGFVTDTSSLLRAKTTP
ncbi:putative isochorismatase hydrolase [Lyophyllum shimeji]|uniref:Isochorismatase hydrolase n=1 Tax=Lyophyllum shimeji TaxID=47721 RepID=A0A9P3PIM8_LYOSH|nr:putative isochorismatase hydrolase [Lyophyllum shimeji]